MAISQIICKSSQKYAKSESFATYGEFVAEEFDVTYAIDPQSPINTGIVDLDKAPLNDDGLVECKGNVRLIRPRAQCPAALFVDVPNRGRPTAFSFNRPKAHELQTTSSPVGDGFLFRHGFAVLTVGWQFDAEGMTLDVPNARVDSREITGNAICQMQPGRDLNSLFVGQGGIPTYQATGRGRLFQRPNSQTPHEEVDPGHWRFGRLRDGSWDDNTSFITHDHGFKKGMVYTLVYETQGAPIVGVGLLAMREAVSYFKYDFDWTHGRPAYSIGYGASQTGRFLRHFLYEGLNEDERSRKVFDAVMPHIAGGQRGDFNHRFAQPGSMGVPGPGQQFPFASSKTEDALSGLNAGLLDRCKSRPKLISTNTSWEYWRGDAALIHVSTDGKHDVAHSEDERIYMFAGTQHVNGILPLTDKLLLLGERVSYTLNCVSYLPLIRAVLVNTLNWLRDNIPPPESQYPKIQDNTLVTRKEVLERFVEHEDFPVLPNADSLTGLWYTDLGPEVNDGICDHPAKLLNGYPAMVSNVDRHLNESAGLRLPEVSIPIGIHSGWNPRHSEHGGSDQTATFVGFSRFDIAGTLPEHQAQARHLVEQATDELIKARYVLDEDRQLVIDNAMKRFKIAESSLTARSPAQSP